MFRVLFFCAIVPQLATGLFINSTTAAVVVDFEDVGAALGVNGFYDGGTPDNSNGWASNGIQFSNQILDFGGFTAWSGWAYSNVVDTATPGFVNQYASYPGGGSGGSSTYAVAFPDPTFGVSSIASFAGPITVSSIDIANTTYAALYIDQGLSDFGGTPFGGDDGNSPDFFSVSIFGLDQSGGQISQLADYYLADYRFSDNSLDYFQTGWSTVDLSGLGEVYGVEFRVNSSDDFAPAYFAADNLSFAAVPEPSSILLLSFACTGVINRFRRRRIRDKS